MARYISTDHVWNMIYKLDERAQYLDEQGVGYIDEYGNGYSWNRDIVDAKYEVLQELLDKAENLVPMKQVIQSFEYGGRKFVWVDGYYKDVTDER